MGFKQNQRTAFLKLMMSQGVQPSFWNHLKEKKSSFLRPKSATNVQEYTKITLLHMLEDYQTLSMYTDGCIKDPTLRAKPVLARIVTMYLIQCKLNSVSIIMGGIEITY